MFRSLPSRIQLSEREVCQTLQKVIIERAVRQQLENLRLNSVPSDLRHYCHVSPWSPLLQSSSSGYVCTPNDATGERPLFATDALERGCLSPTPAASPWDDMSSSRSFAVEDGEDGEDVNDNHHHLAVGAPVRLVRNKPNEDSANRYNPLLDRDEAGPQTTGVFNEVEDDDGSPPEQETQTLPIPRYRVRRAVGSGYHGAFL